MSGTQVIESRIKKNLPIGVYSGYWSGYEVKVNHDGDEWFLKTKDGVRGLNIPVSITVTEIGTSVVTIK